MASGSIQKNSAPYRARDGLTTANFSEPFDTSAPHPLTAYLSGSPWLEVLAELWKLGRRLWRGLTEEGMYEVLEYEATLELKDDKGKHAHFHKRQKVRYLQSNIISYRRSRQLENAVQKLPDGRYRIKWETDKPRLYERYILSWEW